MTKRKETSAGASPETQKAPPRGTPQWAIVLWWLTFALGVGVVLASLPGYSVWLGGQSPVTPGAELYSPFYVFDGLASLAIVLVCFALAFVLFRRKRDEPMALFVSFYVMVYGFVMAGPTEFLETLFPGAEGLAIRAIQPIFLTVPTIALIILFPDGRPVPRWGRWLIVLATGSLVFLPFLSAQAAAALDTPPAQLWAGLLVVVFGLGIWCQIYRYRRVSSPAAREQTRWVVFGLATWVVLLVVQGVPYIYLQNLPPGTPAPPWAAASTTLWWLSLGAIPLTLTISILRYRLYDIDVIINRTLVYGALTAILAGLYSASISLFQRVFIALTGEKSDAAIVLTTLILASVFTPLRIRLQAAVDKRFKDVHDPSKRLRALAEEVGQAIWVLHPQQGIRRLLSEAVAAFDATGGMVYLGRGDDPLQVQTTGDWIGEESLAASLEAEGRSLGRIALGPRKDKTGYSPEDSDALTEAACAMAAALAHPPLPPRGIASKAG